MDDKRGGKARTRRTNIRDPYFNKLLDLVLINSSNIKPLLVSFDRFTLLILIAFYFYFFTIINKQDILLIKKVENGIWFYKEGQEGT